MKFPPFLHSHLRLTLLGTPPNRVFFIDQLSVKPGEVLLSESIRQILKQPQNSANSYQFRFWVKNRCVSENWHFFRLLKVNQ
jgi:hypothetical protein